MNSSDLHTLMQQGRLDDAELAARQRLQRQPREVHEWREGRAVIFDDTYEHEAWNRSEQTRVVLIFDLWNPHLTEVERAAVAQLVPAMGDFRKAAEAA